MERARLNARPTDAYNADYEPFPIRLTQATRIMVACYITGLPPLYVQSDRRLWVTPLIGSVLGGLAYRSLSAE